MEKGKATGPQARKRRETGAQEEAQEQTVARRDDRERRRQAYAAVRIRLSESAERLLQAFEELPEAGVAAKPDELPVGPLQALEKVLAALVVDAEQLRDAI